MPSRRDHDLVLLGATGFAGRLTASHLSRTAPPGLRWAVAGRSRQRLEELAGSLAATGGASAPAVVVADVDDAASMRDLAASTRVLATTVGPYVRHGDPVVAACAAEGTDYADITGEPEFVDRTWLEHHEAAERSGARLVHACGFDSAPHDLGVPRAVELLAEGGSLEGEEVVADGYVRASGAASGGTWTSLLQVMGRQRQARAARGRRREREGRPADRRVHAPLGRPHRHGRHWAVPLPSLDPAVVAASARAQPHYGRRFTYGHWLSLPTPVLAAGVVAGAAALGAAAQVPPVRSGLERLRPAGSGPDPERRARSWFSGRYVARTADRTAAVRVTGPDPGYDATAVMLGEAALCLACDELPETAGQVTTAVAMGPALRERLQRSGIAFEDEPC